MTQSSDDMISPLTSLRFFAALAVIFFHSGSSYLRDNIAMPQPIIQFFLNGYLGVTFFFVLSGFILQLVYSGKLVNRADLQRFFNARIARIYPVYLLALVLIWPFEFWSGLKTVPQFFLLQSWAVNGHPALDNWNLPAWTLSIELFFYLIFPMISRCVINLSKASILLVLALCALFVLLSASPSVTSNLTISQAWMTYVPIPLLRLPEFIIGVAFGELATRGEPTSKASRWSPILIVATVLTLALFPGPYAAGVVALLSSGLIYSLVRGSHGHLYAALSWRPLVMLGASSYSLYLLHAPLHHILELAGGQNWMMVLQYPLLIGIALFVFRYFEEPARKLIRFHPKRRHSTVPSA